MKKVVKNTAKIVTKEYIRDFFCLGDDENADAELETIYARLERISFENGENICVIDGAPDGMYFLESGTAAVLNRDEEQVNLMYEGQYFGEYAVLSQTKRLSTVQAAGRCTVYKLNDWDMRDILAKHPDIYGEFMKRVYGQLTDKHTKILEFTRMRRRNIADKRNQKPMSLGRVCMCYGITAAIIVLLGIISVYLPNVPMFFAPMLLMLGYALVTRRIVEAILMGSLSAAVILYHGSFITGYADDLLATIGDPDNVSTAIDMSLMGCVVALTLASGSVTSFRKHMQRRVKTHKGARLATLGIMMASAIDEDLCTTCAAESVFETVDDLKIPHEEAALIYSLAPTVLCSFVPFSMWGIWVMGTFNTIADGNSFLIYVKSIPYNFFSILTLLALILFCFGKLPLTKQLKQARARVRGGGNLWPDGSEAYLNQDRTATWGHAYNLILPILVMIAATCLVRTISAGRFVADTNSGLIVTLIFMFFLYCGQSIISPDNFVRKAADGFRLTIEDIVLYLLSMNLFFLLQKLGIGEQYDSVIAWIEPIAGMIPAFLFLICMLVTVALGTSWGMFAMAFPIAAQLASAGFASLPLCFGAVCAAGIAGEQNCMMTGIEIFVGENSGCNPKDALKVRMPYSLVITGICFVLYVIAGFVL